MTEALHKPPGTLGRYQIMGEIARGAMGVIYKARDPLIDRIVAIKTVALGLSDTETESFERRFIREAKSAGRLNHPNVVTIHDVGKSGDVAYIAMEFLDGRSLRSILDSGVVLPPEKVADIGSQIAEGLAFAHRHGVVHRDVKPANIMVLHSGRVKITDFGIALLPTGTRTLAGNVFGSPRYTSPEQVMGRPVDGRSDIFSLGAVIYEMLTGLSPFSGTDLNSILKQVLSDPTPAPSSHNPKLPRAFDHILAKALAKDPLDRYQDAQEMAADLRNFAELESTSPAPAPLPSLSSTGEHVVPAVPDVVVADAPIEDVVENAAPSPIAARLRQTPWRIGLGLGALALVALAVAAWRPSTPPAPAATAAIGVPAPPGSTQPVDITVATPPPAAPQAAPAPSTSDAAIAATKPAPPPVKPTGRIALAVTPWGEVYVDGRKRGIAPPLQEIRLAPGKHVVEIRNSTFPPYHETVEVGADAEIRVKHKFQ
jgi:serine/threonine-protein kinase